MKYPDDYIDKVICGDCLDVMKGIPDGSVDLVVTDPPYGITACEWDKKPDLERVWELLVRLGKAKCAYIFMASQPFTTDMINSKRDWFKYEWVWQKSLKVGFQNANRRPLKNHEVVLVFCRERERYYPQGLIRCGRTNMRTSVGAFSSSVKTHKYTQKYTQKYTNYPTTVLKIGSQVQTIHPTQKPVALMEYLIKTYSLESEIILDPFLGSGTTAVAAKALGRRYIGIEISPEYCEIAEKRIAGLDVQPDIFQQAAGD